jgi:CheY-like chemotaxis protein
MKAAKKKILIVDDEIDILELLRARFEANNYVVVTSSNGEDAIPYLKKHSPDALLLDIMMPGIDGLEILKKIRSEDRAFPIFIITAYSNEERRDVASRFNASGFILKTDDLQPEVDKITKTLETAARRPR